MTTIGATMIRQRSVNMIGAGGNKMSAEALAWQAAVIANGGTVSAARLAIVNSFIKAEKSAGTWDLTDDYWPLWAENAPQALTSLKQRRLCTAVAAPTFTVDRGYAGNGTSSYLNTGFAASTMAVAMTGTNCRLAVYQRNDLAANVQQIGVNETASRGYFIRTRGTTNFITIQMNCAAIAGTRGPVSALGLTVASKTAAGVVELFKNGVSWEVLPATSLTASHPSQPIYICCQNSAGTAASFSTAQLGFACIGASLTAPQEAAQYANVQAWATAIGAQV